MTASRNSGNKGRNRRRTRQRSLRRTEVSVPDTRSPTFAAEAYRQSNAVARSRWAEDDQAFIDSIAELVVRGADEPSRGQD